MSRWYGELRPNNGWDLLVSLGNPCKFQRVSRLGSVTARHSSSGRQPNFAALNRGRHLYSAGRPSRWALAHISNWDMHTNWKLQKRCVLVCAADNVSRNPRSNASATHSGRRRSDVVLQVEALLQGRTGSIRLHWYRITPYQLWHLNVGRTQLVRNIVNTKTTVICRTRNLHKRQPARIVSKSNHTRLYILRNRNLQTETNISQIFGKCWKK